MISHRILSRDGPAATKVHFQNPTTTAELIFDFFSFRKTRVFVTDIYLFADCRSLMNVVGWRFALMTSQLNNRPSTAQEEMERTSTVRPSSPRAVKLFRSYSQLCHSNILFSVAILNSTHSVALQLFKTCRRMFKYDSLARRRPTVSVDGKVDVTYRRPSAKQNREQNLLGARRVD